MQQLIITFFLSIILSTLVIFSLKKLFFKFKILDNPKKYKKNRSPIPYSMWITFFICFSILSYFFVDHSYKLYLLLFFWLIVTIVSFLDDMLNVSPKIRLLLQIFIWLIIWITAIKIWYVSNIFWWVIDLDRYFIEILNYKIYLVSLSFTIIWYVFIFNALNWTDWIQWNTAWLSFVSFFVIFLLWAKLYFTDSYDGWLENAKFIMTLSIIMLWIILPFWYFDFKEKILMWDSWTMFLGFILASLAIISWWKIATVLVVFGIYSVDAVYVILKRIKNKKSPLAWDFTHLHHRLLDLWLTKNQVLVFIWFFSLVFWVSSLFFETQGKVVIFFIIILFVVFIDKLILILKNAKK
jgi:UDP-GlcNAc:undecaprenyl-phosphate/decaprenyl-phosphate GlcNAc-1-phosphate transferase